MKYIRWMSRTILSTILVAGISVFTTWFMVNMYVDKLFKQMNIQGSAEKIQFIDLISQASNKKVVSPPIEEIPVEIPVKIPVDSIQATPQPEADVITQDNAIEVWKQYSGLIPSEDVADEHKEIVMTAEDFNRKKDLLTNEDKMEIFSILISRLPQDELQNISVFVEDGITAEELKQTEATIEKYVSEEEYKQLMEILNKY